MLRIAGFVFLLLTLLPSLAQAEKRVALVIGNSAYKHAGELANPRNDATDMTATLKQRGFQVIDAFDLDKIRFDRMIRDFAAALSGADVALFFYAGHGLQVAGQNYLMPVDAELTTATALEFEMVRLDVVQRIMEREAQTNILFLDACRNNPLARNLARALGTRSAEIGRGLAPVESGSGTLISFSTQPGNVALDGTGRNSPFAAALVKHITTSNDDLSALLISVRSEVMKETKRKQVPWEHSALTGRFYFNITINVSPPQPAPSEAPQLSAAANEWSRLDKTSTAELETFLRRHGSSPEAEYARARLADLKQQVRIATPQPSRPQEKRAHAFDGNWELSALSGKACDKPHARWWWKDPMRISGSRIVARGGSGTGRVSADGNFEITVQSKGVGIFKGKLEGDSGEGTYRWSDTGCSGQIFLKRL